MKMSEPFIYSLPMIQNCSFKTFMSKECVLLPIEILTDFFSLGTQHRHKILPTVTFIQIVLAIQFK